MSKVRAREPRSSHGPAPSLRARVLPPARLCPTSASLALEKACAAYPVADRELIARARDRAAKWHRGQRRATGEPYIIHPIAVASELAAMKLDAASVAAGLLHDVLEDTGCSKAELARSFGEEIAGLVGAVSKLSSRHRPGGATPTLPSRAADTRAFLLAGARDVRALLIKLADRLHNMRTLDAVDDTARRARIAKETAEIYAPLAGRIGMQRLREDLENLAFPHIDAEAWGFIRDRLERMRREDKALIARLPREVSAALQEAGLQAVAEGREKQPWSIWRKMLTRGLALEQLSDLWGCRIVLDAEPEACYRALGVIHSLWRAAPGRFKDYISLPKGNGYRSLHTTVIAPDGRRVEMQIRTHAMHKFAERGVAAHWHYRAHAWSEDHSAADVRAAYDSLRGALDALGDDDPQEFLQNTRMELFHDQLFCFTPRGAVVRLPRGATALDFAYAVHTAVGDEAVAARVNGRPTALNARLDNSDEVQIVRGRADDFLNPEREAMATTGKARAAIRTALRNRRDQGFARLGAALIRGAFARAKRRHSMAAERRVSVALGYGRAEEIRRAVGANRISLERLDRAVAQEPSHARARRQTETPPDDSAPSPLPVPGLPMGYVVYPAPNSWPLPGDRLVLMPKGSDGTMEAYPFDETALCRAGKARDGWLDVIWESADPGATYPGRIEIHIRHEIGALAQICSVAAQRQANVVHVATRNLYSGNFHIDMDIEARDVRHIAGVIAGLENLPIVASARRALAAS